MEQFNYADFIEKLRGLIPEFSLENIINDIEKAVESKGIEVMYSEMKNIATDNKVSGYVHVVNGLPEIVVNGYEPEYRRRFTIAHELGHIFLHWGWLPGEKIEEDLVEITYRKEIYTSSQQERETQANKFAIEFLAPQKEVMKLLDNLSDYSNELKILLVSSFFRISKEATKHLLKDLDAI
ncbi:ImmA/IrrE family metallo-endopeptidase [Gemelliphila palaticanis]|uniref:ImmA/IrrE family metallo-endopeptidase n=1 Tax=Gemelliphila palaticanis TaxID=81950 RepID=A0ABX2T1H3_9BACL|nr:ImmA/IrrE family metallo-endopeptidase [Gemella palaticanis]MBF0715349.1 ImmA/IrrE family metallo-endopeptidase [Gemella palaticanis]NYS47279.1 ImmA/IrrE family metallo-endopeptidase [Gemella palaticanis]